VIFLDGITVNSRNRAMSYFFAFVTSHGKIPKGQTVLSTDHPIVLFVKSDP
jgi:hypothetical protein